MFGKLIRFAVVWGFLLGLIAVGAGVTAGVLYYNQLVQDLPRIESLHDYRPKAVTQILAEDGTLMAEAYEEQRYPVKFDEIPQLLKDAFLAAEDANFYKHPGIDFISILRAVWKNIEHKDSVQGASTITQQVVKSLLLSREKTMSRKAKEAILSYRLEKALTKNDIFTIYLNQIFLGSNAYGVKAAAKVHFHKELKDLSVAEAAFLAGLPQRPSIFSSKKNFRLAVERQNYVIRQLLENGMISADQAAKAKQEKLVIHPPETTTYYRAPYYAGHVLKILDAHLAEVRPGATSTNPGGFIVRTSADVKATGYAERALQKGLREIDKRRGWRGVLKTTEVSAPFVRLRLEELQEFTIYEARVEGIDLNSREVLVSVGGVEGLVELKDAGWARRYLQSSPENRNAEKVTTIKPEGLIKVGDIIEVSLRSLVEGMPEESNERVLFQLDQTPEIQGALVLVNALTGVVKVIVGGYDFHKSVFNRATQGLRQPGSSFKPFIYTAAVVEKDMTPSSIVPDEPISLRAGNGEMWTPSNFDNKFLGPITMRTALQKSRNVVSVFLLRKVGIDRVINTAKSFGFTTPIGRDMSISLGTSEVRMIEIVRAYGVFAAGGWLLDPIFISSINDNDGKELYLQRPRYREVLSEDHAFIMAQMMKGVVERGTATSVKKLKRPVAGKTGTTNDHMDTWFIGYTPEWVCGVWAGFDEKRNIGKMETGGKAAAPIFINFMEKFLEGVPPTDFTIPDGVIPVLVNLHSGKVTSGSDGGGFVEYFKSGTEPLEQAAEPVDDYLNDDQL